MFELLGSLPGSLCFASALCWTAVPGTGPRGPHSPTLVLAVGASDGAVYLWTASADQLAHLPALSTRPAASSSPADAAAASSAQAAPPPSRRLGAALAAAPPMQPCGPVLPPDLKVVTSLDAALRYPAEGASPRPRMVLAVGKCAGRVGVWVSADLDPAGGEDAHRQALARGALGWAPKPAMGSHTVSGVALLAAGELVVACAMNGTVLAWLPMQQEGAVAEPGGAPTAAAAAAAAGISAGPSAVILEPAEPPLPCNPQRAKHECGRGAFGVAASPGRLFVAVARMALPPGIEFVK